MTVLTTKIVEAYALCRPREVEFPFKYVDIKHRHTWKRGDTEWSLTEYSFRDEQHGTQRAMVLFSFEQLPPTVHHIEIE